jgi:hypothetical protein
LRAPFAVRTERPLFVAFAGICPRCASRDIPCWPLWRQSLSASLSLSPGAPKLFQLMIQMGADGQERWKEPARYTACGLLHSHFLFGGRCGGLRSAPPSSSQARTMLKI